jgi:hypothetical protein
MIRRNFFRSLLAGIGGLSISKSMAVTASAKPGGYTLRAAADARASANTQTLFIAPTEMVITSVGFTCTHYNQVAVTYTYCPLHLPIRVRAGERLMTMSLGS